MSEVEEKAQELSEEDPVRKPLSTVTNRKRTRSPNPSKTNESTPPRKKAKKVSSSKKSAASKSTGKSKSSTKATTSKQMTVIRIRDIERFEHDADDDENDQDDIDQARKMKLSYIKSNGRVYVSVSDLFRVAFKYKAPRLSEAKADFVQKLNVYLLQRGIREDDDDVVDVDVDANVKAAAAAASKSEVDRRQIFTLFNGNSMFISEKGFCILLELMFDYDESNVFIEHWCLYRYYYRKQLFGAKFKGIRVKKAYGIDQMELCRACFLDDIEQHFVENPCDCRCPLHLHCNVLNIEAQDIKTEDNADWFCPFCIGTKQSLETLKARRECSGNSGEFEVEKVLTYDELDNEYFVKWKGYPEAANCCVALSASFRELVDEFWKKEIADGKVKKIPLTAQKSMDELNENSEANEVKEAEQNADGENIEQQMQGLVVQIEQSEKSNHDDIEQKEPVKDEVEVAAEEEEDEDIDVQMNDDNNHNHNSNHNANVAAARPEDDIDIDVEMKQTVDKKGEQDVVQIADVDQDDGEELKETEQKSEQRGPPKFIPVKLADIMDPDFITAHQTYTHDTYARYKKNKDKFRRYLQSEVLKKSKLGREVSLEMTKSRDGQPLLPRFFLQSVHADWDCSLPRIRDIILDFLNRDWKQWGKRVSQNTFVIGEILDPQNPAKKYASVGVHENKAYGLFATQLIPKDSLLFEYAGCVRRIGDASRKLDHLETELDQTTLFDLIGHLEKDRAKLFWGPRPNDQLVIDPSKYHNEGVYMNDYRANVMDDPDDDSDIDLDNDEDRKKPPSKCEEDGNAANNGRRQNIKFYEVLVNNWPRVFAVALYDIQPGEELLGDYGADYWNNFRLMMRRQTQLAEIKQRIHDEWQQKYDALQSTVQEQQREIQGLKDKIRTMREPEAKKLNGLILKTDSK